MTMNFGADMAQYSSARITVRTRVVFFGSAGSSDPVSTLTLELKSGGRLFAMRSNAFPGLPDTRLPAVLSDGQSAHLFLSYREIADALLTNGRTQKTKLTPLCQDSLGNVYKGKPWEVDPVEFSRM